MGFNSIYFICTDYLSINKEQTLKAIALESRSDFVTWMSALRLAKYGGDELSLAYKNCLMPPAPSLGKHLNCSYIKSFKKSNCIISQSFDIHAWQPLYFMIIFWQKQSKPILANETYILGVKNC